MTSTEPPTIRPKGARASADIDAAWREHSGAPLRYATVLVGPDDAHDITVNTFLRVIRSPQWSAVRNIRAYLIRALTNQAHDHRRQQQRRWTRDLAGIASADALGHEADIDIHRPGCVMLRWLP